MSQRALESAQHVPKAGVRVCDGAGGADIAYGMVEGEALVDHEISCGGGDAARDALGAVHECGGAGATGAMNEGEDGEEGRL